MAIYKRGQRFELGMTKNKSSKWPEWDSNLGLPDCESEALTVWPCCSQENSNRNTVLVILAMFAFPKKVMEKAVNGLI